MKKKWKDIGGDPLITWLSNEASIETYSSFIWAFYCYALPIKFNDPPPPPRPRVN